MFWALVKKTARRDMVEEPQNEKRKEAAQLRRDDSAFSVLFFFLCDHVLLYEHGTVFRAR